MTGIRKPVLALLATLPVAACSGAEGQPAAAPTATVTATVTATETVTVEPEPTKPTSSRNLGLGERWTGSAATVTVLRYQRNSGGYGAKRGERWDAVLVRSCVRDTDATAEGVTFSWAPWSLLDRSGGLYPASNSTYNGFPRPEYPFAGTSRFRPGDCAKGWIVFNVSGGASIDGVRYGNGLGETATWRF